MSLETTLTEVATRVVEVQAFANEAEEILIGAKNLETFNKEPEDVQAALQNEISVYRNVINLANTFLTAAGGLAEASAALLSAGYPVHPTTDAFASAVANLVADQARNAKALAHLHALLEATGGTIEETELPQ